MRQRIAFRTLLVAMALVLLSSGAYADVLSGCGTCQGSTYQLVFNGLVSSDPTTDVYSISLIIDTSGYTGGGLFIKDVAIKSAGQVDFANSDLLAAPGGAGAWTLVEGGLNAGGCMDAGSGFLCAQDGTTAPANVGATYEWVFAYAVDSGTPLLWTDSSIKARYVDEAGDKVGALVSEDISLQSPVPEPTSILLLGSAMITLGAWDRRRRRKSIRS